MKSMGLALTIFSLTGMLVALDLSGASGIRDMTVSAAHGRFQSDASHAVVTAPNKLFQEDTDDEDEEIDPGFHNAFLVTPTPATPTTASAPAPASPVRALRYD